MRALRVRSPASACGLNPPWISTPSSPCLSSRIFFFEAPRACDVLVSMLHPRPLFLPVAVLLLLACAPPYLLQCEMDPPSIPSGVRNVVVARRTEGEGRKAMWPDARDTALRCHSWPEPCRSIGIGGAGAGSPTCNCAPALYLSQVLGKESTRR